VSDIMRSWWVPNNLHVVGQRELAYIIVVQNPVHPGGRNQVVASLRGSLVCSTSFMLSSQGLALKWHGALVQERVVFISDQVRAAHTGMVDLVCASNAALGRGSKWRLFVGTAVLQDFQTLAAKASQSKAFVIRKVLLANERRLSSVPTCNNTTSLQKLLDSLKRLDKGASLMGMCKR